MKRLTNTKKLELVLNDLNSWLQNGGNQSDDSLVYAYENGYFLHAASLWLGSGAMSEEIEEQVKGIRISRAGEKREIKKLCAQANIYICPDCNHHAFLDYDEGDSIQCSSCLKTAIKEVKNEKL